MKKLDNYTKNNTNKIINTSIYFIKNTFTNVFNNFFLKNLIKDNYDRFKTFRK